MNRDEILAKSRAENGTCDERETQILYRAGYLSKAVGGVICALINFITVVWLDELQILGNASWAIYMAMSCCENWFCAAKLRNKKKYWIFAVVFTIFFLLFSAFFVRDMIVWMTN